jgi:hypothetical protein
MLVLGMQVDQGALGLTELHADISLGLRIVKDGPVTKTQKLTNGQWFDYNPTMEEFIALEESWLKA